MKTLSYTIAKQMYLTLRLDIMKSIDKHFTGDREEFTLKTPLIIIESEDGNNNQVLSRFNNEVAFIHYDWEGDNPEETKLNDLHTIQLISLLEFLDKGWGEWDVKDDEE